MMRRGVCQFRRRFGLQEKKCRQMENLTDDDRVNYAISFARGVFAV
jgi:hypothetical protein